MDYSKINNSNLPTLQEYLNRVATKVRPKFTLIVPYYKNPEMLRLQVENWNSYPADVAAQMNIVLIDDCSPVPAEPIFRECTLKKALFRVEQDIPWNQHGARNLGAKVFGKDQDWGLFTDMDCLLAPEEAAKLAKKKLDPVKYYTFERYYADGRTPKVHVNTFLVQRAAYWKAGGYNEDFCGMYGGDAVFIRQMEEHVKRSHLLDVAFVGYDNYVEDANTREWGRQGTEWHDRYLCKRGELKASKQGLKPLNPIRFPWHRVF